MEGGGTDEKGRGRKEGARGGRGIAVGNFCIACRGCGSSGTQCPACGWRVAPPRGAGGLERLETLTTG
eukprot:6350183-Pyramimonas_sp.AAC.1